MYPEISLRPIAVAVVLAATAIGSAEAGDEGYRGQYDRTYSAQAEQRAQRSGVRLRGGPVQGSLVREGPGAVPDYRVVRGYFDGERRYRLRQDAARWGGEGDARRDAQAPSAVIVGSGRFSGNANELYRRGAGSYFTITTYDENTSYGAFQRTASPEVGGSRSRVVTVGRSAVRRNDDACSFEAGVCVIRGR